MLIPSGVVAWPEMQVPMFLTMMAIICTRIQCVTSTTDKHKNLRYAYIANLGMSLNENNNQDTYKNVMSSIHHRHVSFGTHVVQKEA